VVKPERTTLHRTTQGPGYIQAYEQTAIFAKIPGYVRKWHVDIGNHVQEREILAELWIPEMEVELKQKEALVGQAEAELRLARAAVGAAEAEYKRAKSQHERLALLRQSGTIDKENSEEATLGFEASLARRDTAWEEVRVREARLEVAKQNRDQVKTLLAYRQLTAPFNGVITRRNINTDDFVQPPTAGKGEPLYVVERRDIMRIFVPVREEDSPWVNQGLPATVRVQALPGQEFTAKVQRTSYSLDRAAHTLLAEIDLPNPQDRLRPNMYAYAVITLEQPDVLTLPASAVVTQGDVTQGYQTYCFIVEDGKLRRTLLQVGARSADRIEVLKKQVGSGRKFRWQDLTGEEIIVQDNLSTLTDGQAVQVSQAER
jgi:RND family efflux transporter MFP subunit